MNPKLPIYTYFKTFLSSPSPENKYAQVSHQQRLNASTSTPQAKASRSIGTQSHRHNGLKKNHNNEHAEIPAHPVLFSSNQNVPGQFPNLVLTVKYARSGLASRTSLHQRSHAMSKSITEHLNATHHHNGLTNPTTITP